MKTETREQSIERLQRGPHPIAVGIFVVLALVFGWFSSAYDKRAEAAAPTESELHRDEVRALERIANQLDKINDTLRDKCGR